MADLSHWDFAQHFSWYDAAALILGFEPRESEADEHRVRVVAGRMELDYLRAFQQAQREEAFSFLNDSSGQSKICDIGLLCSVQLEKLWRDFSNGSETPLSEWLADRQQPRFENQEFDRTTIVKWLKDIGMVSAYQFDLAKTIEADSSAINEIDPADYPDELHAANIAFRAVTNGYGDQSATIKNRLIDYLEMNFPALGGEAVQRIATVANPDKGRGRKKGSA